MSEPIYLDYNATTPIAPEVLEAMLPWLRNEFGNPSSTHPPGRRAAAAIARARQQVATLVGAAPAEIVFTGSATEANNLALLGAAEALASGDRRHLIVSAVEHPAVLEPARVLRERGWAVTVLPVDRTGRVAADVLGGALRTDTALVSVMHANNEVGTLQPVAELARLAHERGALFHTDAAQSAGKLPLNVEVLGVDLLTLAGHKFHAPKGVGALYVRAGTPIRPVLFGADQQHGLRPGTENVAFIVALGAAAELAVRALPELTTHLRSLRDRLHDRLLTSVPDLWLNGHPEQRLPNTLHVSFPDVSGRALLAEVAEILAASVGSACHSEHDSVSGVLAAMGVDATRAAGAVRLSVGRATTPDDIDRAGDALVEGWQRLRHSRP
jgi:cysteine desulfurase